MGESEYTSSCSGTQELAYIFHAHSVQPPQLTREQQTPKDSVTKQMGCLCDKYISVSIGALEKD